MKTTKEKKLSKVRLFIATTLAWAAFAVIVSLLPKKEKPQ